jgi:hypothetical protein
LKRSDFGVGAYVPNVSDQIKLNITAEALGPKAEYWRIAQRFLSGRLARGTRSVFTANGRSI